MLDENEMRSKYLVILRTLPTGPLSMSAEASICSLCMNAISEGWDAAVLQFRSDLADFPDLHECTRDPVGDKEVCRLVRTIQYRALQHAAKAMQEILGDYATDMNHEMEANT